MPSVNLLNKIDLPGADYQYFIKNAVKNIESANSALMNEEERHLFEYTKLNIKRSERIEKTYAVSPVLNEMLMKIDKPQVWMAITEIWCGDSAQNLPYIAKMADVNPMISLKIVLRDQNPAIMEQYLTNGTRSIPILVSFDSDQNELFRWGPRPKEAAELVRKAKEEGKPKDKFIEELHLWYGRNKGKAIEEEFIALLSK